MWKSCHLKCISSLLNAEYNNDTLSVYLFFPYLFLSELPSVALCICLSHSSTHTNTHNRQSVEFPFRDFTAMLIKHAEKIKWATWQLRWHPLSASLSLTHQSCRVTKKQWEGGGRRVLGVVLGYFPWRTTLLPFPVHQWQLHLGNSRY